METNVSYGQVSGFVEYFKDDAGAWSFRLKIYATPDDPIIVESNVGFSSEAVAKDQVQYALEIEEKRRKRSSDHGRRI